MRLISGLIGLALTIAIVQTAISPKTKYFPMTSGGWMALHPDGTYTAYPRTTPPAPVAAPVVSAPGRDI